MPRSRRRYDDDDDDDDRPIRRRTRRKGKNTSGPVVTAVVIGVISLVVLFVGGVCVGVYSVLIHPKVAMQQRIADDIRKEEAEAKVSKTKLDQLRGGMTLAQVEAVMGPGRLSEHFDLLGVAGNFHNMEDVERRWRPVSNQNLVYVWDEFTDRILVAFSTDPKRGGTVVGIIAAIHRSKTYTEPLPPPAIAPFRPDR